MEKKIILFLSERKENAQELTYNCPDGSTVTGTQTNEAPVKYLLMANPEVTQVLCVVTPKAEGAFPDFERMVKAQSPAVKVISIPFGEGNDFSADPLPALVAQVKTGESILLDTTGGLRDAIMQLLLVSRVLSYSGIPTAGAVYSNFFERKIIDCSHLIGLFDLVGGMQELASFGSVHTLRTYYEQSGEEPEPAVKALLDAMEGLNEDITLCRTGRLGEWIEKFNTALQEVNCASDPMMKALLPAFQAKFGKKLTVPGLIKWCTSNGQLQQALTIYNEQIPDYILKRRDVLYVKEWVKPIEKERLKEQESEERARFRQFLNMGNLYRDSAQEGEESPKGEGPYVKTMKHFDEVYPRSFFTSDCSADQVKKILMDYLYIRILRNMTNHANDQPSPDQKAQMDFLKDYGYRPLEEVTVQDVREALEKALQNLQPKPERRGSK